MKTLSCLALLCLLVLPSSAANPRDNITIEALIVTKAELRRHMAAPEDDKFRPASYADLEASRSPSQPDYLVVRFLATVPGHYFGEAEAKIDGGKRGVKVNVTLHFNRGWVEYFIPLDGLAWQGMEHDGTNLRRKPGSPAVNVDWISLQAK